MTWLSSQPNSSSGVRINDLAPEEIKVTAKISDVSFPLFQLFKKCHWYRFLCNLELIVFLLFLGAEEQGHIYFAGCCRITICFSR